MTTNGLLQKVKWVLMTQPGTIAPFAALQNPFISRSAILRPTCVVRRSVVTMNKDENPELDAVFNHKRALRSRVRKELRGMSPEQRSQEDNAIQSIILDSAWFKSSKRLCAYISCAALREVDTSRILSAILCNPDRETRKKLYVPRVEDKNSHMRMLSISRMDDLIANTMNILEPSPVDDNGNEREDVMQATDPVDLLLLPGLAFDRCGRRLGRGGGYYDLFLKKYQELAMERQWKQPLHVALSYSLQIRDEGDIPVTPNDVPVDALVTPAGIIPISQAALEICG